MTRAWAAALLFALCTATHASAQDWNDRLWISANGGVQTAGSSFSDTIEIQQFVETGTVKTDYPTKTGVLADVGGGIRLWKGFAAGVAVTTASNRGSAAVDARIPHPFFDNQFRTVQGSTSVTRSERIAHLQLGYMLRLSDRLRTMLSAGPSWLSVEQTFVLDVQYSQTYPYDTATYTGATTRRISSTATGFNAAADLSWMFAQHIGAGGLVRYTRGTAHETVAVGHTVSVKAGGLQAGAGVRLIF
jgi:hypothetical protein